MNVNSVTSLQSDQSVNRTAASPLASPPAASQPPGGAGSTSRQMAETVYISRQAQQMLDTYTETYAAASQSKDSASSTTESSGPSTAEVVDATRKAQQYQMMQAMAESGALQGNGGVQPRPQPLPAAASPADTTARPSISLAV